MLEEGETGDESAPFIGRTRDDEAESTNYIYSYAASRGFASRETALTRGRPCLAAVADKRQGLPPHLCAGGYVHVHAHDRLEHGRPGLGRARERRPRLDHRLGSGTYARTQTRGAGWGRKGMGRKVERVWNKRWRGHGMGKGRGEGSVHRRSPKRDPLRERELERIRFTDAAQNGTCREKGVERAPFTDAAQNGTRAKESRFTEAAQNGTCRRTR